MEVGGVAAGKWDLAIVIFGDGGGVARSQDFRLENDAGKRFVKAVGVAVGAKEGFLQDNTAATLTDLIIGRVGENFGGGGGASGSISHGRKLIIHRSSASVGRRKKRC